MILIVVILRRCKFLVHILVLQLCIYVLHSLSFIYIYIFFLYLLSTSFIYRVHIFMTTHILSSFLIKTSEIENLLDGLIANDNKTLIKSIYSIWPPLFLITDFNLPWKASQEACSTSWEIKAYSRSSCKFIIIPRIMSSANLTLQNWLHRKVKRVQIQAPWGPFIFANECWNVSLNPAMSHFGAMWWSNLVESKVHHQSAYVPREAVQLPKCLKYNTGCSVSLLRVQKRVPSGITAQWLWWPPTPSQKVDSGIGLLSCLPLIHLYSKLYHFCGLVIAERQIFSHQ